MSSMCLPVPDTSHIIQVFTQSHTSCVAQILFMRREAPASIDLTLRASFETGVCRAGVVCQSSHSIIDHGITLGVQMYSLSSCLSMYMLFSANSDFHPRRHVQDSLTEVERGPHQTWKPRAGNEPGPKVDGLGPEFESLNSGLN